MLFYYTADVSRFLDCTDWQKFEGHIVSVSTFYLKNTPQNLKFCHLLSSFY